MGQRRAAQQSEAELRLDLLRPALEAAYEQARKDLKAHPPLEPPGEMAPFLRFTKFPVRALRAAEEALECEEFRDRVAAGAASSVAGPARLVLTRDEGWQGTLESIVTMEAEIASEQAEGDEIRQLTRRLDQAEAARDEAASEAQRALAKQSELESELAVDRARAQAAQQDLSAAEQTLSGLQRRVSELSQRATKAEQNLGAERSHVKELEDELAARQAPVVAASESPAPVLDEPVSVVPQVPVIDRDRLAASMAAASEAASQMSRALTEMSLIVEPPAVLPLDELAPRRQERVPRRVSKPLPRAMLEDSDEATDYLLRLADLEMFVDGYNVTLQAWPHMQLPEQRTRLIAALTAICANTRTSIRVVFDGAEGDWAPELPARCPVLVQFAPPDIEADDIILEHLARLGPDTPVAVVSSDRRVQDGARKLGAYVVTSEQMLRRL